MFINSKKKSKVDYSSKAESFKFCYFLLPRGTVQPYTSLQLVPLLGTKFRSSRILNLEPQEVPRYSAACPTSSTFESILRILLSVYHMVLL